MFQPIFSIRKFKEPTLGSYLRNGREKLNLSLAKVAQEIAVSAGYVKALEEGNYSALPPEIYVKGFINRYCNLTGLDYDKAIYLFDKNKLAPAPVRPSRRLIAHSWLLRIISYRNFIVFIALLFLATLFFYLVKVIYPMYSRPYFTLNSPQNCPFDTSQENFELKGIIQPEGKIWINDEDVMVDKEGNFTCSLFLHGGENVIKFRVVNKFSKERQEECVIRKN